MILGSVKSSTVFDNLTNESTGDVDTSLYILLSAELILMSFKATKEELSAFSTCSKEEETCCIAVKAIFKALNVSGGMLFRALETASSELM